MSEVHSLTHTYSQFLILTNTRRVEGTLTLTPKLPPLLKILELETSKLCVREKAYMFPPLFEIERVKTSLPINFLCERARVGARFSLCVYQR